MTNELYQYLDNKEIKINELVESNKSINVGYLNSIMSIEKSLTKLLLIAIGANYEVFNSELPSMDKYRMKEKGKQLLAIARISLRNLLTPYFSSLEMHDLLAKSDDWDSHPVFKSQTSTVSEMNSVVLMKMSLIHRHVSYTLDAMEKSVISCTASHDIGTILPEVASSLASILTAFTGYTKFIDTL